MEAFSLRPVPEREDLLGKIFSEICIKELLSGELFAGINITTRRKQNDYDGACM